MTFPAALISTPAEHSFCDPCSARSFDGESVRGSRFQGDTMTYPHCPQCGSTELLDDRSPFVILKEAYDNWQATDDPHRRMIRWDALTDVAKIARDLTANHCGDCARHHAGAQHILRHVAGQTI